jgi:hypothetical protein
VTELQVYQYGENDQDSAGQKDALSIHVLGEDPSRCLAPSTTRTQGTPKAKEPR